MSSDDLVVCRYCFKASRKLRKVVRLLGKEYGMTEHEVVLKAIQEYKPVREALERWERKCL